MNLLLKIILIVIIILIIVGILFLLKKISMVKENSAKYQKLEKLNDNFDFIKNCKKVIKITHYVTKKEEISKLNIDDVLKELFLDNTNNALINFENVYKNENNFSSYEKKYKAIKDKTSSDLIKITNLSDRNFKFIENKLFKSSKANPTIKTKIKLSIKFDGLKGEHEYKKEKTFNYSDLISIYENK